MTTKARTHKPIEAQRALVYIREAVCEHRNGEKIHMWDFLQDTRRVGKLPDDAKRLITANLSALAARGWFESREVQEASAAIKSKMTRVMKNFGLEVPKGLTLPEQATVR